MSEAPCDNLIRARYTSEAAELRADGSGRTLFGHFAVFNTWTEIDSAYEGQFLERIAPGAFARSMKERASSIRVLYDHGRDPSIGNKPLGAPDVLREEPQGAYYESELFDAPYVNDLLPALRAGQLGASFRFSVLGDTWVQPKKTMAHNPKQLPERTINDTNLYEFGPVTFPAYTDASAGVRSATDSFIDRLLHDPKFVARFTERAGLKVVEQVLAGVPVDGRIPSLETTDGLSRTDDDESSPYTPVQRPTLTMDRLREELESVTARVAAASARSA